ncbi:hypothetical protein PR202_gb04454 [Eleusine coracana subsp. coracana]|uniref:YDG domain-containing protein n=1 Tax=Eleusine coracana subsp. coracana TaxID=191504 RepID=A0AAV5E3U8_ELECO|nr:hypothetical protein PR202_gb04454 [Eleusine coracana subsp. coracana]
MPTPDQDVLDVKPLRTLAPMFPAPLGVNTFNQSTTPPLVLVAPAGLCKEGFGAWNNYAARSFFAFSAQDACGDKDDAVNDQNAAGGKAPTFGNQDAAGRQNAATRDQDAVGGYSAPSCILDVVTNANGLKDAVGGYSAPSRTSDVVPNANGPIDATPISAYKSPQPYVISLDDDDDDAGAGGGDDNELYTPNQTSASGRKIKRSSRLSRYKISEGFESDSFNIVRGKRSKSSHKKSVAGNELAFLPPSGDPREIVDAVLMTFEALRRRHLQLDETQHTSKRADLKAGAILMANDLRANTGRRIGFVPGVEVGDIFYFRMELCIVGLHAPSMGGIDYMTTKFGDEDDSVAICIVAAGGYDNNDDDTDVLVYSGSGGNGKNSEERQDQKLERGNLALERSLSRKNVIRVVRGYKDPGCLTGKVYMYDGIYRIHESWKERTKTGITCFKYKLLREPGQPDGFAIWKMTQKWVENPTTRGSVLHPDLSSGTENLPVVLVNDVDNEKRPGYFTYITEHNGGNLPYNSSGLLVCHKPMHLKFNSVEYDKARLFQMAYLMTLPVELPD